MKKDVEVIELEDSSSGEEDNPMEESDMKTPSPPSKATVQTKRVKQDPNPLSTPNNTRNPSSNPSPSAESSVIDSLLTAYEKCFEKLTSLEMSMTPEQCRRWLHLHRITGPPPGTSSYPNRASSAAEDFRFQPQATTRSTYVRSSYPSRPKTRRRRGQVKRKTTPRKAPAARKAASVATTRQQVARCKAKMMFNTSASTSSSTPKVKSEKKPSVKVKREGG